MNEFSTKQELLFYSFPLQAEERNKIDGILALLDRSGIAELVRQHSKKGEGGRPSYNPYKLFAAVLLGFSFGASSLRNMESACRNDLRFIYVMDGEIPAYTTICSFINETILPIKDELFFMIMKTIFDDFHLDMNTCFIDGTKIEADANRYKFVWKPTKWHQALDGKARSLLAIMGLADDLPKGGYLPSLLVASKIDKAKTLLTEDKAWNKKLENLTAYLLKIIEYEEKERICGSYRNSYYKTDHDATAMCLKQDYYSGLGSSMHAAYSIQFITSYGFVVAFLVSQDRTDMYVFARTIDKFRESYGFYPSRICADAGYGCTENWRYCHEHAIKGFVKYGAWQDERNGRNPAVYEIADDGSLLCLGGRKGYRVDIPDRHPKKKGAAFYRVDDCTGCVFMPYCSVGDGTKTPTEDDTKNQKQAGTISQTNIEQ